MKEPLFTSIVKGKFLQRLNRFALEVDYQGGKITAHLPNPGRLWELLLPGVTLYLVPRSRGMDSKYPFSCVAVEKEGEVVLLHTQEVNRIAARLIENEQIPGLEGFRVERTEVSRGRHRFDLLLRKGSRRLMLEVKSCTLFGNDVAMFPDAVTKRGKEHVSCLARLQEPNLSGGVLFMVATNKVSFFSPDYHTDLAFAQTLLKHRGEIFIKAVGLSWNQKLTPVGPVKDLVIPWEVIEREAQDRGAYLFVLEVPESVCVDVGALGTFFFKAGFHIYVGSARNNLDKRLRRHLKVRKKTFWHIDYLRPHASKVIPVAIRTSQNLEHELAGELQLIAPASVPRFGASDCDCKSHLFFFNSDPLKDRYFLKIIERYRVDYLSTLLK